MTGDRGWSSLDGRDNALNAIRLVLATLVIYGHTYLVAYDQAPPIADIHAYAVDGFFVLAGFLIAGSRERLPLPIYLQRRARRLLPGLAACMLVCAFILGPIAGLASGRPWSVATSWDYLVGNASFQMIPGYAAAGFQWNVSLWTLPHEVGCYVAIGVLFALVRDRLFVVLVVVVACAGINLLNPDAVAYNFTPQHAVRLLGFFSAGALLYLLRDRVPRSGIAAAASSAVVVALMLAGRGWYWAFAPLFLAYALLWLGTALPVTACQRTDVSYGTYIYGLPVQQALIAFGVPAFAGPLGFFALSLAGTVPLAFASWRLVEHPAMRRRRRTVTLRAEPSTRPDPTNHPHAAPSARARR